MYDASHPDKEAQIQHVRNTLKTLVGEEKTVIEIANKCDLIQEALPEDTLGVSALHSTGALHLLNKKEPQFFIAVSVLLILSESHVSVGIDLLRRKIEKQLLAVTGRSVLKVRVEAGSRASAWLYKETTVTNAEADPDNQQFMLLDVITTEGQIHRFRRFLKEK